MDGLVTCALAQGHAICVRHQASGFCMDRLLGAYSPPSISQRTKPGTYTFESLLYYKIYTIKILLLQVVA